MTVIHPLKLTRSILDPLHGTIRLTTTELRIVDHELFRRLHRVRQNGLLYLVFPSATHTRFEHSLGTMFVADSMLQALIHNCAVAKEKPTPAVLDPGSAAAGQAFDLGALDPSAIKEIFEVTRLAALVHDLGHGPFSHHFDPFAPKSQDLGPIIDSTPALKSLKPLTQNPSKRDLSLLPEKSPNRVSHEEVSCLFFGMICRDLGLDEKLTAQVAAVILGRDDLAMTDVVRQHRPLLTALIASAPADADRMDYLERDSLSIGVSYGLFDRNRLLQSVLPYRSDDDRSHLGIKASGLRAVENFVQARFELFVQVYYHKTNRAIELMLRDCADRARELDLQIFDWPDAETLVETYCGLSDESFMEILRGQHSKWKLSDQRINDIASLIKDRRLWKRIYWGLPDKVEAVYTTLVEQFPDDPLHLDIVDPKATKDLDERGGARLLRRGEAGVYKEAEGKLAGSLSRDQSPGH